MASEYNLRKRERQDYQKLADIQLPRQTKGSEIREKPYPIEVVEREGEHVKIHYIGYGDDEDEWREASELVQLSKKPQPYIPFELHRELAYQIQAALDSRYRKDPDVRIEVPFDKLLFDGGLKQHGHMLRTFHGHDVYTIYHYSDLEPLLGEGWHMRGINDSMNFCYVNLQTVQYHLHERKGLDHYWPDGRKTTMPGGHILIFRFVRMDGLS